MKIIEIFRENSEKPFGIIGIDDKGELFVEGLDKEYYLDWLSGEINDEDGNFWTQKDGVKFLEAVKYKLMKNVYFDEMEIKGPSEISKIPELEKVIDDGHREVVDEYEDLEEEKGSDK